VKTRTKKKKIKKKSSFVADIAKQSTVASNHLVVEAFAGTGKTFTEIVGVGWAFANHRWEEIQRRIAIQKKKNPKTFRITPSAEQEKVWSAFAESVGKVETIQYSAFNRSIVEEFQEDWGWLAEILSGEGITLNFSTVNGLGHRAVMGSFNYLRLDRDNVQKVIASVTGRDLWDLRRNSTVFLKAVTSLVDLCKLTLTGWTEEDGFNVEAVTPDVLGQLVRHYGVELDIRRKRVFDLVPRVLERCLSPDYQGAFDFNDQNWLPVVLNLPVPKVDLLLIDEGQDLPRCKQEFSRLLGRRIVLVGDVNQAIYGFAGADVDSIPRMKLLLSPDPNTPIESLRLTETRRCSHAVVKVANKILRTIAAHHGTPYVPFTAHKDNLKGSENFSTVEKYPTLVQDGDMVLCRVNAPLVSQALRFLQDGRRAIIRGRDFGKNLINFIQKKLKAPTVEKLIDRVEEWHGDEVSRELRKKPPSETRLVTLDDRRACVIAFTEGAKTVEDVVENINLIFSGKVCPKCQNHFSEELDRCPKKSCKTELGPGGKPRGPKLLTPKGILFSSIHKAKGLESERVFIILKDAPLPHPMAKSHWSKGQEYHLKYVAVTRAIESLIWVA